MLFGNSRFNIIQQRVFTLFLRVHQRSFLPSQNAPAEQNNQRIVPVKLRELWWNPEGEAQITRPDTSTVSPPPIRLLGRRMRPIGPSPDLPPFGVLQTVAGGTTMIGAAQPGEITHPITQGSQLQSFRIALNFYSAPTSTNANWIPKKDNLHSSSEGMQPFNEDLMFTEDLWFLHSTWTSWEKARAQFRLLVTVFGIDNLMMNSYVPMDLTVLPDR